MFRNQSNQIRAGWLIMFAFLLMFAGQAIFMLPAMALLIFREGTLPLLIIQSSGSLGGIVATLLVWKYINKATWRNIGLQGRVTDFIFGLLLGALSITFMVIILLLSNQVTFANPLSAPNISLFTFTYLIFFILVGFVEEIFFRGYVIQTLLSRNNKPWVIYIVSALLFSLVHGTNPNVSYLGLFNILLVGLLFAYMFIATKSLWLPTGYHITWNYFQGNIFGFSVSGIETDSVYLIDTTNGAAYLTGGSFGLEGGVLTSFVIIFGFFITKIYLFYQKKAG